MIKRLAVAVILLVTIFSVSQVYCQDDSMKTIGGRVVSVDPQASMIVVKTSEVFTFSVASGAQITNQGGLDLELSDINPGNYVMVGYYNDRSGAHIAKNINVEYNR